MGEVECGRGPPHGWSDGSGSRGLWAVLDRPVTNVSCLWSHLLKSRDVPVNLFNLCFLCQRISLFLPGWASWILCEPDQEETWMSVNFQKDLSGKGLSLLWDSRPDFSCHLLCLLVHPVVIRGSQETLGNCLTHAQPSEMALIVGGPHYASRWAAQFGKEVMTKWKLGIILFICNSGSVGYFTSYTVWVWTDKLELCPSFIMVRNFKIIMNHFTYLDLSLFVLFWLLD